MGCTEVPGFAIGLAALGLACGNIVPKVDAGDPNLAIDAAAVDAAETTDGAAIDAPGTAIDARPIDARPVDAAVDAGANCQWIDVVECDTGGTIAEFCPSGTHVNMLRRCDGSTYMPDLGYQQFHLCSCAGFSCGCNNIGVVWSAVECCEN